MMAREARKARAICPFRSILSILSSKMGIALMNRPKNTAPAAQPTSTSPGGGPQVCSGDPYKKTDASGQGNGPSLVDEMGCQPPDGDGILGMAGGHTKGG